MLTRKQLDTLMASIRTVCSLLAATALMLSCHRAHADALDCLADNIYYEAANEPYAGKVAVAQVTINRAAQDFQGDVCAAVYFKAVNPRTGKKEAAFSWTLGRAWRAQHVDPVTHAGCMWLADLMLRGGEGNPLISDDVKFYHAVYVHPRWRHMVRVAQIGLHVFYKQR